MKQEIKVYKGTEIYSEVKYICCFDDYHPHDTPINLYNKIRKFLGLKFKAKEFEPHINYYSIKDGILEHINRKKCQNEQ